VFAYVGLPQNLKDLKADTLDPRWQVPPQAAGGEATLHLIT